MEKFLVLDKMIDELVSGNIMSDLDPVIRSMTRQLHKRYLALTEDEQKIVWLTENLYIRSFI